MKTANLSRKTTCGLLLEKDLLDIRILSVKEKALNRSRNSKCPVASPREKDLAAEPSGPRMHHS